MTLEDQFWGMEERLWTGGDAFGAVLHEDALMVFPAPAGILAAQRAISAMSENGRWDSVEMTERVASRPIQGVAVLAYLANATRAGQKFCAYCSSTYVSVGGDWRLAHHQQTPEGGD